MSDLISRQAAIDALEEQLDYLQMLNKDENPTAENKWYGVNWARNTIADLPSAQPTQTNCEYCHTDSDGYIFPLDKNAHAFIDRDEIVLKANGWRGKAKIKYCPICGRRLTDG